MDHTVLPVNTPCLPFFRKRSPDDATPNWGKRHLIAAYYSSIDPEGMKRWVGLVGWPIVDKWSSISYRSSAGQGKFAGQRPTFYHSATRTLDSKTLLTPLLFVYNSHTVPWSTDDIGCVQVCRSRRWRCARTAHLYRQTAVAWRWVTWTDRCSCRWPRRRLLMLASTRSRPSTSAAKYTTPSRSTWYRQDSSAYCTELTKVNPRLTDPVSNTTIGCCRFHDDAAELTNVVQWRF